ncbi:MAG: sterol desaturase family protein [Chitinophagaceae bacterium]|nr:sterol desaturase family protein [Chitinophagaceae bacterium]
METYGNILLIAMPAFLILVLFEKWYGWKKGRDTVRNMDMISSLSSGVTNVTKDVLGLAIAIGIYPFMLKYLAVTKIENTIIVYILTFIIIDFLGYWVHRISHKVNLFWNLHVIHHSSEEFNLACALRQSISSFFNLFTILLLPAAVLGIPPDVIAIVGPIQLFAQFWYHTQHINKMGFLEKIIVTPSHHRVHHAVNPEYMDKNLSQIFIVWDKLFGTYVDERKDVPPVYGITRPARTWNPIKINFQHIWLLIKDAWRTNSWKEKFTLWFKPTGYRPADVAERYPVKKIEDVYNFEKYDTRTSPALNAWAWVQLLMLLGVIAYLFGNIAYINSIDSSYIYWYGAYVFLTVYALTDLMDRNRSAIAWEILRSGLGLYFLYSQDDWFGSSVYLSSIKYILGGYFILSITITGWFVMKHRKEDIIQGPELIKEPVSKI